MNNISDDEEGAPMTDKKTGKPPWWVWYEPPRWFPAWLHRATCTYCRGMAGYARDLKRGRAA